MSELMCGVSIMGEVECLIGERIAADVNWSLTMFLGLVNSFLDAN